MDGNLVSGDFYKTIQFYHRDDRDASWKLHDDVPWSMPRQRRIRRQSLNSLTAAGGHGRQDVNPLTVNFNRRYVPTQMTNVVNYSSSGNSDIRMTTQWVNRLILSQCVPGLTGSAGPPPSQLTHKLVYISHITSDFQNSSAGGILQPSQSAGSVMSGSSSGVSGTGPTTANIEPANVGSGAELSSPTANLHLPTSPVPRVITPSSSITGMTDGYDSGRRGVVTTSSHLIPATSHNQILSRVLSLSQSPRVQSPGVPTTTLRMPVSLVNNSGTSQLITSGSQLITSGSQLIPATNHQLISSSNQLITSSNQLIASTPVISPTNSLPLRNVTPSPNKKIQYLYKQGGQTYVIESAALMERLRAAATAAANSGLTGIQLRLPLSALRPVNIVSTASSSVGTGGTVIGNSVMGMNSGEMSTTGASIITSAGGASLPVSMTPQQSFLAPGTVQVNSSLQLENEGLAGRLNALIQSKQQQTQAAMTSTAMIAVNSHGVNSPSSIMQTSGITVNARSYSEPITRNLICTTGSTGVSSAATLTVNAVGRGLPRPSSNSSVSSLDTLSSEGQQASINVGQTVLTDSTRIAGSGMAIQNGALQSTKDVVDGPSSNPDQSSQPSPNLTQVNPSGNTVVNTNSNNPTTSSPTDLIRQLNLARAQGLVVLQQWGDKQVLVHKATGRWIMRQGSRLVTVPPQALGIFPAGTSGTAAAAVSAPRTTNADSGAVTVVEGAANSASTNVSSESGVDSSGGSIVMRAASSNTTGRLVMINNNNVVMATHPKAGQQPAPQQQPQQHLVVGDSSTSSSVSSVPGSSPVFLVGRGNNTNHAVVGSTANVVVTSRTGGLLHDGIVLRTQPSAIVGSGANSGTSRIVISDAASTSDGRAARVVISGDAASGAISSRTMERLAEFDSILESKFKTDHRNSMGGSGNAGSASRTEMETITLTGGDPSSDNRTTTTVVLQSDLSKATGSLGGLLNAPAILADDNSINSSVNGPNVDNPSVASSTVVLSGLTTTAAGIVGSPTVLSLSSPSGVKSVLSGPQVSTASPLLGGTRTSSGPGGPLSIMVVEASGIAGGGHTNYTHQPQVVTTASSAGQQLIQQPAGGVHVYTTAAAVQQQQQVTGGLVSIDGQSIGGLVLGGSKGQSFDMGTQVKVLHPVHQQQQQLIQLPTSPIRKEILMSVGSSPNINTSVEDDLMSKLVSAAGISNSGKPMSTAVSYGGVTTTTVKFVKSPESPTTCTTAALAFPKSASQVILSGSTMASLAQQQQKPQEDPETLKRIQAILDDYNDQIRNSPDLNNRPAPRRRTNGPAGSILTGAGMVGIGNPDSPKADSPGQYSSCSSPSGSQVAAPATPSPIMQMSSNNSSPVKQQNHQLAAAVNSGNSSLANSNNGSPIKLSVGGGGGVMTGTNAESSGLDQSVESASGVLVPTVVSNTSLSGVSSLVASSVLSSTSTTMDPIVSVSSKAGGAILGQPGGTVKLIPVNSAGNALITAGGGSVQSGGRQLRQLMVPSNLAASLSSNGQRLVLLNSNGRMVAVRPLLIANGQQQSNSSLSLINGQLVSTSTSQLQQAPTTLITTTTTAAITSTQQAPSIANFAPSSAVVGAANFSQVPITVSLPTTPLPVSSINLSKLRSQYPPLPPALSSLAMGTGPQPTVTLGGSGQTILGAGTSFVGSNSISKEGGSINGNKITRMMVNPTRIPSGQLKLEEEEDSKLAVVSSVGAVGTTSTASHTFNAVATTSAGLNNLGATASIVEDAGLMEVKLDPDSSSGAAAASSTPVAINRKGGQSPGLSGHSAATLADIKLEHNLNSSSVEAIGAKTSTATCGSSSMTSLTSMTPPASASRPTSPERPVSPSLGIPIEMTPGQIMEAEISASLLDSSPNEDYHHEAVVNMRDGGNSIFPTSGCTTESLTPPPEDGGGGRATGGVVGGVVGPMVVGPHAGHLQQPQQTNSIDNTDIGDRCVILPVTPDSDVDTHQPPAMANNNNSIFNSSQQQQQPSGGAPALGAHQHPQPKLVKLPSSSAGRLSPNDGKKQTAASSYRPQIIGGASNNNQMKLQTFGAKNRVAVSTSASIQTQLGSEASLETAVGSLQPVEAMETTEGNYSQLSVHELKRRTARKRSVSQITSSRPLDNTDDVNARNRHLSSSQMSSSMQGLHSNEDDIGVGDNPSSSSLSHQQLLPTMTTTASTTAAAGSAADGIFVARVSAASTSQDLVAGGGAKRRKDK